ncbi:hypothetical protein CCMSSC00406_0007377 [Pleurotus cornucopiae]|uniref:Uncharacterized protein n=1 Tax=Pleurotus cornucopiae TaxID=5321 RepID=A0ACB7IUL5_PLECO|nr:hypothetical protein CCMSSC00406_0007377 [Pleurotus cornucopiae]
MFNNAGNNTFDFDAKYGRDFNVKNGQQTEKELDNGWEFTSKYSVVQGQTQRHTIAGLSVFTAKDPKQASFDFSFGFSLNQPDDPSVMYSVQVDTSIKVNLNLGGE